MTEWAKKRNERRSLFCSRRLWAEIIKETKECYSVSQYIRFAIFEKLVRDHPENESYYREIAKL